MRSSPDALGARSPRDASALLHDYCYLSSVPIPLGAAIAFAGRADRGAKPDVTKGTFRTSGDVEEGNGDEKTEVSGLMARLALVGVTLMMSSCVSGGGLTLSGPPAFIAGGLQRFSSCDDFLEYVKGHASERVMPWGLPGGPGVFPFEEGALGASDAAAGPARGQVPAPAPGTPYSTTNVQTAGVDEPDIVKTDGERVLALAQGKLFFVDLSGPAPHLRGSLSLTDVWVRDMVLLGDRALLLGETGGGGVPRPLAPDIVPDSYGGPIAALVEVDVSDPDRLRITRRLLTDGRYLSARMIDGVVRVVVSSYPTGLPFVTPEGPGLRAEREALERNREVIRESTIENWVPYFVLEDEGGETLAEGSLLDCASSHHPDEFSGFGMLTVLTLDLSEGLSRAVSERSVGVLSDGETVYASAGSLYVATQRWMDWEVLERADRAEAAEGHVTQIHRFDISGSGGARYRASGQVTGWLLNQFSMDEYGGHLRVASTDSPPFGEVQSSESMVTVLAERDGRLAEIGRVGGLGKGEQILAVRFLGDLGYVVTFRQVDPLYVVDLSDPVRPEVAGELKILGYSAYLHPLGDDLLLGVGQDATQQGSVKGTQMSVFDVSDPSSPRRIDQVKVSGGNSEVEWDHHAFLYWEPEGLAVLPVNVYGSSEGPGKEEPFFGALAVRVRAGELEVAGRLRHKDGQQPDSGYGIRRSLVVGDLLYTVAETGVEAVDLVTLRDVAWVPFR
jgi:hypothetical protein